MWWWCPWGTRPTAVSIHTCGKANSNVASPILALASVLAGITGGHDDVELALRMWFSLFVSAASFWKGLGVGEWPCGPHDGRRRQTLHGP